MAPAEVITRIAAAPAEWDQTEFWRTEPSWVVERRLIEEGDRVDQPGGTLS